MDTQLATLETLFKALADTTRLRILGLLLTGEVCVCDIHDSLRLPQPKVSRHLAYLRRAGLVEARKAGLWVHYRMTPLADPVMQALIDAVGHAITHLESHSRDRKRLSSHVNASAAGPRCVVTASCCAPGRSQTSEVRIQKA